jgi:hypothetical protein
MRLWRAGVVLLTSLSVAALAVGSAHASLLITIDKA